MLRRESSRAARSHVTVALAGDTMLGRVSRPCSIRRLPSRSSRPSSLRHSERPTLRSSISSAASPLGESVGPIRPRHSSSVLGPLPSTHWRSPESIASRSPLPRIRAAAAQLLDAGATVIAGHSAHVFHGVEGPVLYDLGDFADDYATDPVLRNDLGLLFPLTLDPDGPVSLEAVPLKLEYCHTRLADGHDAAWICRRFRRACADLATEVDEKAGRLIIGWSGRPSKARPFLSPEQRDPYLPR